MSDPSTNNHELFLPNPDDSEMEAVVLAAAIGGSAECRVSLPSLAASFREPNRTLAFKFLTLVDKHACADLAMLRGDLSASILVDTLLGNPKPITPDEAVTALANTPYRPEQAEAYLEILNNRIRDRRRNEERYAITQAAGECGDSESFARRLMEIRQSLSDAPQEGPPSELSEFVEHALEIHRIQSGNDFLGLDSGFPHLNNLCNGLDTGLFVIAAPPGMGKTTLCWQIACQAADLNHVPVIFISYEQSKRELRAKAHARLGDIDYRHILRGRLQNSDATDIQKLRTGLEKYLSITPWLTVIEAEAKTAVPIIREQVRVIMKKMKSDRALLIVDYLQAIPLTPEWSSSASSDKAKVDLNVTELRRLARDLNVSVLCISSQNRAGYGTKKMNVFKESGGIEYGTDVAAILTSKKTDKVGVAQRPDFRELDLNVVKNRNGEVGIVRFKFYPKQARFVETERAELDLDDTDSAA